MTERFSDLVGEIPSGSFYPSLGEVLPHRSGGTELRLVSDNVNTRYRILINDIQCENSCVVPYFGSNKKFNLEFVV